MGYSKNGPQNLNNVIEQLEERILERLKVASLAEVLSINVDGYQVQLIPQINRKISIINTKGRRYQKHFKKNDLKEPEYIDEVEVGDLVLVVFLDSFTQSTSSNVSTNDTRTKHSYSNAVVAAVIDKQSDKGEII